MKSSIGNEAYHGFGVDDSIIVIVTVMLWWLMVMMIQYGRGTSQYLSW